MNDAFDIRVDILRHQTERLPHRRCLQCGTEVSVIGADMCLSCWALETFVVQNPEYAATLLQRCGYFVAKSVFTTAPFLKETDHE